MKIETVYEVKNSNGKIGRYSYISHLYTRKTEYEIKDVPHWSDRFEMGKYYLAKKMEEPHDLVILNDDGDIVWNNAQLNINMYVRYGKITFFGDKCEGAKYFGLSSGGQLEQFITWNNLDEEIKTIKEGEIISKGICIWKNIVIDAYSLSVYKGNKKIIHEKTASNVKISLKNISDMNVLTIYCKTSEKEKTLFFDQNGEELEMQLIPKKRE